MSASSLAEPLPAAAPAETDRSEAPRWSLATRIAFRFVFAFLGLMYFPFPLDIIPRVGMVVQNVWNEATVLLGSMLLGVLVETAPNGSGDRTADWIQLLIGVSLAAAVTVIWSFVDHEVKSYPRLWRWFHVWIRFALAGVMLGYGAYKVIPSQFIPPGPERLMQPIGDASPMGLLWTFMGASMGYTIFTGLGEMIGGLLLTVRRTTLLGALITAGVMTHVVALNFFYDVPVKIFSSLLLFTALVVAAPDAKKLLRFFVLDRPSDSLFTRPKLRIAARVAVALFVGYLVTTQLKASWDQRRQVRAGRLAKSPLSGIWTADTPNAAGWRRLIVSGPAFGAIQSMDDSITRYAFRVDAKKSTLVFNKRQDPKFDATLHYTRPDPKTLTLTGTFGGKPMTATLHREDDRQFRLTTRGFHWVNEMPFNR